jgi:hypothetical protein
MKRTFTVLTLLLVAGAGCLPPQRGDLSTTIMKAAATPQRPPAVYAESITDDNAHQKALALEAEMDFEVQSSSVPAPTAPAH